MSQLFKAAGARSSTTQIATHAKEWLFNVALPLWFDAGTDVQNWGFAERLDADAKPIAEARRINVQARQTYVFALAGAMGWQGRDWLAGVAHGLLAIERYRGADGLYVFKLHPNGDVADAKRETYGQAFVLFAWAHAGKALNEVPKYETKALELLTTLKADRSHPKWGFLEDRHALPPLRSNPHMHLFEAAQAWMSIGTSPQWSDLAKSIADLALDHFIAPQTGWLRELFDANWLAIPDDVGMLAEPGHQFEWAWLLARYGQSTGQARYVTAARVLYERGLEGLDPARGVPFMEWSVGQGPRQGQIRLWPTTEWLKAALIFQDYAQIQRAYAGLETFLAVPLQGLWADKMQSDGTLVDEPAPASTFYHIICAIAELQDHTDAS